MTGAPLCMAPKRRHSCAEGRAHIAAREQVDQDDDGDYQIETTIAMTAKTPSTIAMIVTPGGRERRAVCMLTVLPRAGNE
jgi:hypothetical protein